MLQITRWLKALGIALAFTAASSASGQSLTPFRAPDVWQRFTSRSFAQGPSRFIPDGSGGMMFWFQQLDRANGQLTGAPILLRGDGSVNPEFRPGALAYNVGAVARTSDGKWLVAYTAMGAEVVVRLNADGSRDPGFEAKGFTQGIRFLTPLPNGDILVAVSGSPIGNPHPSAIDTPTATVVKLYANGQVDPFFTRPVLLRNGLTFIFTPPLVDSQGRFYLGGAFATAGANTRYNLARYLPNGVLDDSFAGSLSLSTTLGGVVRGMGFQSNGKLVVVGNMLMPATLPPTVPSTQRTTNRFVALRFDSDGRVDPSFQLTLRTQLSDVPSPDYPRMLVVQPDDRIVVAQDGLRRLNADGTADPTFSAVRSSPVFWVGALADGRIVMPGGLPEQGVTIVNSNGVPDRSFAVQGFGTSVETSFALLPGGRVALAGKFNRVGAQPADGVLLLEADGTPAAQQPGLDAVAPDALPEVLENAFEITGTPSTGLFFSGRLHGVDPLAPPVFDGVRRFTTNGLPDTTFTPPEHFVAQIYPARDGSVWYAGTDAQAGLYSVPFGFNAPLDTQLWLTRRSRDGSIAPGFQIRGREEASSLFQLDRNGVQIRLGSVRILAEASDGSVYVEIGGVDGETSLAKIRPDGTDHLGFQPLSVPGTTGGESFDTLVDPAIGPSVTYSVLRFGGEFETAVELSDGSVLVGGSFGSLPGGGPSQLALISPNGQVNAAFQHQGFRNFKPFGIPSVLALARDALDRIYVAGNFDHYGTNEVHGLIRIDRNGRLDRSFNSPIALVDYPSPRAKLVLNGSQLWAGGSFRALNEAFPRPLWKIDLGTLPALPPLRPITLGGQLGFEWPATAGNVVVERIDDLTAATGWLPANGTLTEINGTRRFVVTASGSASYFRVRLITE